MYLLNNNYNGFVKNPYAFNDATKTKRSQRLARKAEETYFIDLFPPNSAFPNRDIFLLRVMRPKAARAQTV